MSKNINIPKYSKIGKLLLSEIIKHVTDCNPQVIIEYNAGVGNISKEILANMHKESALISLERDISNCQTLCKIIDKRLQVRMLPPKEVNKLMYYEETIDCIISSTPFITESKNTIVDIIEDSYTMLKKGCYMMHVMDTKAYLPLYQKYFPNSTAKVFLNMPVLWVYECQK